jgi:GMP synthase (glutamine-hydrolysing)
MPRPFLILQLRPEDDASDGEFAAFLGKGGLAADRTHRVRLDRAPLPAPALDAYAGIIVGDGPGCVGDPPATKDPLDARIEAEMLSLMPEVTSRDMPFLGCCYGLGILARHLGAEVSTRRWSEPVGGVTCRTTGAGRADPLLAGLPERFRALAGHKEAVQALPHGCVHLIASDPCPFQMIRHGTDVYATQFHPEANGEVFADRIRIYRDHGYFRPEEAEALTREVRTETDPAPTAMLARYG